MKRSCRKQFYIVLFALLASFDALRSNADDWCKTTVPLEEIDLCSLGACDDGGTRDDFAFQYNRYMMIRLRFVVMRDDNGNYPSLTNRMLMPKLAP